MGFPSSLNALLSRGPALASCIGKQLVPVGYGATNKHDDADKGDKGDGELRLPEPQYVVERPRAQAEHHEDHLERSPEPALGRKHAGDITVLVSEGAGLGDGHDLCCPTHDEDEAEREEPAA